MSAAVVGHAPLPAALWQADRLQSGQPALPSGYAQLDAELPGGGWPLGAITEVLQPPPLHAEWHLLLPALRRRLRQQDGAVVLVDTPHLPYAPTLQRLDLPVHRLMLVQPAQAAQSLWVAEQALRCSEVAAVLLWSSSPDVAGLPALRRLQLAAQGQGALLVVLRATPDTQGQPSPAALRLRLQHVPTHHDAPAALAVHILKRRGPPCVQVVQLPWQPAWMAGTAAPELRRELVDRTARLAG